MRTMLRTHAKKIVTGLLLLGSLGVAGVAAYQRYTASCCHPGSACCYPGSPCCGHSVASR
jgi:hypothetical protein